MKKASKPEATKSVAVASAIPGVPQVKDASSSTAVVKPSEPVLPDNIDAELGIEVEDHGGITLESLTSDLADESDDLEVDDLDDNLADDDFSEDSGDESDEDLDLTEDLSEELGPKKFFRESEVKNADDDEEPHSPSW